jgi:hypothetical protein
MHGGGGSKTGGIRLGDEFFYMMGLHASINHGGCRCPMATMGPHSWLLSIQQSANILWNRSTLLKLEKNYHKLYLLVSLRHDALTNHCACSSPVMMVVPLMQSIGGNNNSTYMLNMFPLMPCALGLACWPYSGPW